MRKDNILKPKTGASFSEDETTQRFLENNEKLFRKDLGCSMKTLNGQHRNDAGKIFKSVKILEWQAIIPMNYGYNNTIFAQLYDITGYQKFCKIHRKTPVPEPHFLEKAGPRPATLFKKRLWHRYFPVNFAKFLRTAFLQNISG